MKKFLMALCALAVAMGASAQIKDNDKQIFNHVGIGVSAGLDGIGVNLATTITPYIQARAGVNFIPKVQINDIGVDLSIDYSDVQDANQFIGMYNELVPANKQINTIAPPEELNLSAKLNMTNFKLLFDFYPGKKAKWHLTAGFYTGKSQLLEAWTTNFENELQAVTDYNNALGSPEFSQLQAQHPDLVNNLSPIGVEVGEYLIKPEGPQARAFLKVNSFKPYLGIGSGRAISNKHRLSFAWDLGCQFWGTPTIYVKDKAIDKDSGIDGDGGIIKIISKVTVYPTLSIRINGRIF